MLNIAVLAMVLILWKGDIEFEPVFARFSLSLNCQQCYCLLCTCFLKLFKSSFSETLRMDENATLTSLVSAWHSNMYGYCGKKKFAKIVLTSATVIFKLQRWRFLCVLSEPYTLHQVLVFLLFARCVFSVVEDSPTYSLLWLLKKFCVADSQCTSEVFRWTYEWLSDGLLLYYLQVIT